MKYVSTRKKSKPVLISEAINQGLASDGGLFVPEVWPQIKIDPEWVNLSFAKFAYQLLAPFFAGDKLEGNLQDICMQAFDFPLVLKKVSDDLTVLELFHGPTSAFKDFGARFLALCTDKLTTSLDKPRMVLVATSGDTGGAVASAFCSLTKIPVTILYPYQKISQRQEKQLTTWGQQVKAFAVHGSFDDCQKIVKEAFLSSKWQGQYHLLSANSINVGRLLPQMAYFAYASLKSSKKQKVSFVVPSGNVGDATAAIWAQKLGFPIEKIIFAHNANKSIPSYFQTGQWQPYATVSTLANAMDVGSPSNFERILDLYPSLEDLKKHAEAYSVSDEQIKETVVSAYQKWNEVFCPHTATAIYTYEKNPKGNWIVVATAHPAKFETIIEPLIQKTISIPENLKAILNQKSVSTEIAANTENLAQYLLK